IGARSTYQEAYVGRGGAHFELDFLNQGGPRGSAEARDDFRRATELDAQDFLAWGNLGAAEFWLGNYEAAAEATRRAVELRPQDPTFNLNAALFLKVDGDEEGYRRQMARAREVFASLPEWLRTFRFANYREVFEVSLEHRPEVAEPLAQLEEDVLRMEHEMDVSLALHGSPTPPSVEATVAPLVFDLSADRTEVTVEFDYTAMESDHRWQYRTYVDGVLDEDFTKEPETWEFDVPDGGLVLTFTKPDGFESGTEIRTEVFVEGNLLSAGEYVVP
ncbi:MAG: tetratricopeptide repeat protein, partial [Actinomycetota bacterium]|nr:tetratricopeptide repeat protein [Actinomycetota bacterium]